MPQPHPIMYGVAADVVGGHVQGWLGNVHGVDARGRQVDGQVDCDCPAACPYVGDGQLTRLHAHQRHEQRVLHHALGLRPGNQNIRRHYHVDAIELAVAEDVGQWGALQPLSHDPGQLLGFAAGNFGLLLGEDVLAGHSHHRHHHHLGLEARVGDVGCFQRLMGLPDGFAYYCHFFLNLKGTLKICRDAVCGRGSVHWPPRVNISTVVVSEGLVKDNTRPSGYCRARCSCNVRASRAPGLRNITHRAGGP